MSFLDYSGVKQSVSVKKRLKKASRLFTTAEVCRKFKIHKMVLLRWIARGQVKRPAHYCVNNGISLLWRDQEMKALRSLIKQKKRKRLSPFRRSLTILDGAIAH